MINHYRNNNDLKLQLKQVNRLLVFDSIVNKKNGFILSKLNKEFDTPVLIKEKETLINKLEYDKNILNYWIYGLALVVISTLVTLRINYSKSLKIKRKFTELMENDYIKSKSIILKNNEPQDLKISSEIVSRILASLEDFEKNNDFLNSKLSVTFLAKKLDTNHKYLSKIINHHKHKNFINYINDLRIDFSIQELKTNKTIRKYTISGLASEMGFNTSASFSTAFVKKTGIKPSHFIRALSRFDKK